MVVRMPRHLTPQDDLDHALGQGEHEAMYFLFASNTQAVGFVRLMRGLDCISEMVAVNVRGHVWSFQEARPASSFEPKVTLACLTPWQAWSCRGDVPVTDDEGRQARLRLDWHFQAGTAARLYGLGEYNQAQQAGSVKGYLELDGERFELGPCGRDRSWGKRNMGLAKGWTIVTIPACLYLVKIDPLSGNSICFGASCQAEELVSPFVEEQPSHWVVEANDARWTGQAILMIPVFLGPPGQEAVRTARHPGDLYQDEIGSCLYTDSSGNPIIGFLERARRIT